jgi:hypothetical protein
VRALRVAVFPAPGGTNPYGRMLHAELERLGVEFVDGATLDARWVRGRRAAVDAIHLHWIEYLYAGGMAVANACALPRH